MTRLGIAVLGLVLVLVTGLVLVGVSVLQASGTLEAKRAALSAGAAVPDPGVSSPSVSDRVGDALLGRGATREYLQALELARASGLEGQPEAAVLEQRAQAEVMLGPIVAGNDEPLLRSRAANLLGALLLEDAKVAKASPRRYLEQSLAAFQDAVALDPTYAAAKANLELLQALPATTDFRQEGVSGSDASSGGSGESGY